MSPKTNWEKKGMDDKPYCSILGSVMWGQLARQPDLSFSVSLLAQFRANPGIEHWKALMHVIGYIRNTIDYGLTYSRDTDLSPTTFVDANYGGCRDTCRSTSGHVFLMAGGAVTWSSKHQTTITLSTVKAKYVAMSQCAQQMVWMHSWLSKVGIKYSLPGVTRGDNSVRNSPVALRLGSEMDPYRRDLTNILHSYLVSDSFGPVLGARA